MRPIREGVFPFVLGVCLLGAGLPAWGYVYVAPGGSLDMSGCTFVNNASAGYYESGLLHLESLWALRVSNCVFSANTMGIMEPAGGDDGVARGHLPERCPRGFHGREEYGFAGRAASVRTRTAVRAAAGFALASNSPYGLDYERTGGVRLVVNAARHVRRLKPYRGSPIDDQTIAG